MGRVMTRRARLAAGSLRRLAALGYRVLALCTAGALLNLSAAAFASSSPAEAATAGAVTAFGNVKVDGSEALSGQTLFTGSTIATGKGSRSAVDLGNLARLELSEESAMRLDFSETSVGGSLDSGRARVYVPVGVRAALATRDASVWTDAAQPVVFSLEVTRGGTTVSVHSGRAVVSDGSGARTLEAGQLFSTTGGAVPAQTQGQRLSDDERTGIFVGIAAALAAVIIIITRRSGEEVPFCESGPIIPSGQTDDPC